MLLTLGTVECSVPQTVLKLLKQYNDLSNTLFRYADDLLPTSSTVCTLSFTSLMNASPVCYNIKPLETLFPCLSVSASVRASSWSKELPFSCSRAPMHRDPRHPHTTNSQVTTNTLGTHWARCSVNCDNATAKALCKEKVIFAEVGLAFVVEPVFIPCSLNYYLAFDWVPSRQVLLLAVKGLCRSGFPHPACLIFPSRCYKLAKLD